jgi:hypothetical protein
LLTRAEPELLDRLGGRGVVRIEFVVGFSYPWRYSVWLGTRTDEHRGALGALVPERRVAREVLEKVGIPPEHLEDLTITVSPRRLWIATTRGAGSTPFGDGRRPS